MPKINTYTDNATIEDVDAVLTYDPAGSGATKLTTFGRIATWVSTKLAGLAKKTTISSADQILMVNGSAANRIDYNVLAKAILEEYAASSLAGSAQSVKTALDKMKWNTISSASSLADLQSQIDTICGNAIGSYSIYITGPVAETSGLRNNGHFLTVTSSSDSYRIVIASRNTGGFYTMKKSGGTWGTAWEQLPDSTDVKRNEWIAIDVNAGSTREEILAAIDAKFASIGNNGRLYGYLVGVASTLGLPNTSFYFEALSNSANYRMIFAYSISANTIHMLRKKSGTWDTNWYVIEGTQYTPEA